MTQATRTATLPRLLLDCTSTYLFDHHTGIQRVVRNIVRHGHDEGRRLGLEVVPCFFEEGTFYVAPTTADGRLISRATSDSGVDAWTRTKRHYWTILGAIAAATPNARARQWLQAPPVRPGLARGVRKLMRATGTFPGHAVGDGQPPLVIFPGDVLLTLDLACESGLDAALRGLRSRDVLLATLIYDLIPVRHPEGIPQAILDERRAWLDTVVGQAELVIGISNTVVDDLRRYFLEADGRHLDTGQTLANFALGHELERVDRNESVRSELPGIFAGARDVPVFLSVGWLDVRKNQLFVLDAMRQLRARGVFPKWVIAGKRGPTTDDVLARFREVNELAEQIFVFHDLSDTELEYCFESASALIYPSTVEGFGLPLVEALSYGLPVFASDIPVFRELASEFAVFFGLDSPTGLADLLERFCADREYPSIRPVGEFQWPSWRESVAQLFAVVMEYRALSLSR
jgi:glycosyltransferase involved in cell wall biosynthesis